MSGDPSDLAAYQKSVNESCMKIFEACSFQDITGQRITKVVKSVTYVEDRVNDLIAVWGKEEIDRIEVKPDENPRAKSCFKGRRWKAKASPRPRSINFLIRDVELQWFDMDYSYWHFCWGDWR